MPEASTCNFERGAMHGNALRGNGPDRKAPVPLRKSRDWY
jgi:hypothetical protein